MINHIRNSAHLYLYVGSAGFLLAGIWAGSIQAGFTGIVLLIFAIIAHASLGE